MKGKVDERHPDGFYPKRYYPTLAQCYNDLLGEFTKQGEKETLKENVEEAVRLLEKVKLKAR